MRKICSWATLVVSCLAMSTTSALAQSGPDVAQGAPQTTPRNPVSSPSALSITTTSGGTTASGKLTFSVPFIAPLHQEKNTLSLILSSPISKGADSTSLATLDSLQNSTSLELQLTHYEIATDGPAIVQNTLACVRHENVALNDIILELRLRKMEAEAAEVAKLRSDIIQNQTCREDAVSDEKFESKFHLAKATLPPLLVDEVAAWKADLDMAERDAKVKARALAFGLTGKVAYEQHKYILLTGSPGPSKGEKDVAPYSAGLFFTYVAPGWNWAITGEYQHQLALKDQDSGTLCPLSTSVATCLTGSIGMPSRNAKDIFSLELRHAFPTAKWIGGSQIAIAPQFAYDARNSQYGINLPVYLFGTGQSLNGGVSAGWNSDKHHVIVGLFVTQPFNLPGKGTP